MSTGTRIIKPHINIITRTSERPVYFHMCRESIIRQTYKNAVQIVSYDSDITADYVSKYSTEGQIKIKTLRVDRPSPIPRGTFPYNLYCNALHTLVGRCNKYNNQWIMYLDDDDVFVAPDTLSTIAANIMSTRNAEDSMFIWKVKFPNKVLPHKGFGNKPMINDVCSAGFIFNSKWLSRAIWDNRKGSDFRVIQTLFKCIPRTLWINKILAKINYNTGMGGLGARNDVSVDSLPDRVKEKYIQFMNSSVINPDEDTDSVLDNDTASVVTTNNCDTKVLCDPSTQLAEQEEQSDQDEQEEQSDQDEQEEQSDQDEQEEQSDQDEPDNASVYSLSDIYTEHAPISISRQQRILDILMTDEKIVIMTQSMLDQLISNSSRGTNIVTPRPSVIQPDLTKITAPVTKKIIIPHQDIQLHKPHIPDVTKPKTHITPDRQVDIDIDIDITNTSEMCNYFDYVYVINIVNRGVHMASKLKELGFSEEKIWSSEKCTSANNDQYIQIIDCLQHAKEHESSQVLFIYDTAVFHDNILSEFNIHIKTLRDIPWYIIYLGCEHTIHPNLPNYNSEYYADTNPDLGLAGLTTDAQLKKHWTSNGYKEKRVGDRILYKPSDTSKKIGSIVSFGLSRDGIDEMSKRLSSNSAFNINSKAFGDIQQEYPNEVYVMRPNLIIHRINHRLTLSKRDVTKLYRSKQWNTILYAEDLDLSLPDTTTRNTSHTKHSFGNSNVIAVTGEKW